MPDLESISSIAAIICGIASSLIVIYENRRVRIGLLFILYILTAILLNLGISPQVVIKLISGVTATLILTITTRQTDQVQDIPRVANIPSGLAFRMISVLLVTTAAVGIGRSELVILPDIAPQALSAALLIGGMGLLQVSLFENPINVAIGILMLLNGFEIAYVVLETSLAVMALLAIVHISIAVVIAIVELDVERDLDSAGNP
jgi:hypothetical protein